MFSRISLCCAPDPEFTVLLSHQSVHEYKFVDGAYQSPGVRSAGRYMPKCRKIQFLAFRLTGRKAVTRLTQATCLAFLAAVPCLSFTFCIPSGCQRQFLTAIFRTTQEAIRNSFYQDRYHCTKFNHSPS